MNVAIESLAHALCEVRVEAARNLGHKLMALNEHGQRVVVATWDDLPERSKERVMEEARLLYERIMR